MAWEYGQQIWDGLMADIGNEYGVAGLMGNLYAESALIPYRVQGDNTPPYTYSQEYTAKVDTGDISEDDFVNNGPNGGGYGLAQWTYYTRKQGLYDMKVSMGTSIGSVDLAIAYLLHELKNSFNSVYLSLKNATNIRTASDIVLHDFESPADQSESVEELREGYGVSIYEEYVGTYEVPESGGSSGSTGKRKKMPIWMLLRYGL